MKAFILVVIFLSTVSGIAQIPSEPDIFVHGPTGGAITEDCSKVANIKDNKIPVGDGFSSGLCVGYILGVIDNNAIVASTMKKPSIGGYCIPRSVAGTQLAAIVAMYGREHPEEWHESGILIVVESLRAAFPC